MADINKRILSGRRYRWPLKKWEKKTEKTKSTSNENQISLENDVYTFYVKWMELGNSLCERWAVNCKLLWTAKMKSTHEEHVNQFRAKIWVTTATEFLRIHLLCNEAEFQTVHMAYSPQIYWFSLFYFISSSSPRLRISSLRFASSRLHNGIPFSWSQYGRYFA